MTSWSEVKATHRHVQQTVRVPMRADLVDEIDALERQALREKDVDARENRDPVAPQLAQRIQELEAELAGSEVAFTFLAIGRRAYAALLAEHPATPQQQADAEAADRRASYNSDTFPPAFLAAACIAPAGMTVEDWTDIWENWSEGQVAPLWGAVLAANMGNADVGPKSQIASAILTDSARS